VGIQTGGERKDGLKHEGSIGFDMVVDRSILPKHFTTEHTEVTEKDLLTLFGKKLCVLCALCGEKESPLRSKCFVSRVLTSLRG
jgi:hypothetical protein